MSSSDILQLIVEIYVKMDEIDQKQLKTIRRNFMALSETRFKRMESSLLPTQADYLKLLPLLFHVNQPILPGYVDKFTPCGIPNYTPSMLEKRIAKTVSQSFEYKPRAHLQYRIASLFLMGSTGTLGQSTISDIDLWICLAEPLENKLITKLKLKANRIKYWLAKVGVELNFYLVNSDDFSTKKIKKIESDSCGNTQNYLLLDEFYRTSVWFAGRWPLWWLIPTDVDYSEYANKLLQQKYFDFTDWIDFGEVKQIPASEYFSAALWQLYKAIDSPYKSLVKLLVLEVYAKLFPCAGVLSDEIKSRLYQNNELEQDLDPYLQILLFAEKSLQDNPQRLEFLRRAFYLKANVKITQIKKRKPSWRYTMMAELVNRWGWNQARLDYLNSRHQWGIYEVLNERKDLVKELTSSYHFLSKFARVQGVINKVTKSELLSLGRILYAAFERKSGKIEQLNNGIAKDVYEPKITLSQDKNRGWGLYLGHINQSKLMINQPVFVGHSLFECLSWGCINRVISNTTRFHVYQINEYLSYRMAGEFTRDIIKLLDKFSQYKTQITYNKEAQNNGLGIFINTRTDPLVEEKQGNLYRVVSQSDCFCWTDNKINLANHFDVILINSWGEITTEYYSGESAWIEFFNQYQNSIFKSSENIPIYCRGLVQKDKVVERVTELLKKWNSLLVNSRRSGMANRYLMTVGRKWLVIDLLPGNINFDVYGSLAKLYTGLSSNPFMDKPEVKIKFHLDPLLTLDLFVKSVVKRRLSDTIDFFIHQKNKSIVEVMVKSVNGSVHFQLHKNISVEQVIEHYQQFFEKIQNRNLLNNGLLETVNYFEYMQFANNQTVRFRPVKIKSTNLYPQFFLVQAIATQKEVFSTGFDLFTAEASFYYLDHGENVYSKLRNELLKARKERANYPIFLTDLDLSAIHKKVTIIESLNYKKMIEAKLNKT